MKTILIRHGTPDYSDFDKRHFIGHGRDLAKLSTLGVQEAHKAAEDTRLGDAEIIITSPYTRALQTAAIISRITQIPLIIKTDLHEWMPDLSFTYSGPETIPAILEEMDEYRGEWTPECRFRWESLSAVGERAFTAVKKYLDYDKVIIVAHETLLQRFVKRKSIPCCAVIEMELNIESQWLGYYTLSGTLAVP